MFTKAVSVVVDGKTTKVSGPAGKLKQISCVDVTEKKAFAALIVAMIAYQMSATTSATQSSSLLS